METFEQQRRPEIGQFAKTLIDSKLEFDAIDLADMLWLAQFIEPKEVVPLEVAEKDTQGAQATTVRSLSESSPSIGETALNLYPDHQTQFKPEQGKTNTEPGLEKPKGQPFSVPAAPALRTRLDLARALRPLMRKVPSRTRFDLDEDATVQQIAETEVWMPVVRPQSERWLELDLVVEDFKTTAIWERAIAELNHLAEYQGAFRAVRTWRLATNAGKVQLFPRWRDRPIAASTQPSSAMSLRPRSPRELIDPTGRRLIWFATDCTSPLWREGIIHQTLLDWSKAQPIAILQMFPSDLWPRTALRDGHVVTLSATTPGLPSAHLDTIGLPRYLERRGGTDLVTVPIVTLDAAALYRWAGVVSGAGNTFVPGRTFDLAFLCKQRGKGLSNLTQPTHSERTAAERVALFRSTGSKTARKLANLMAATPVSLPVIDLLRDAFRSDFNEEVQQYHVAEVLLSGLLRRCDTDEDAICRYEFWGDRSSDQDERVRDILLGDASISKTIDVLDVLTRSIAPKLGLSSSYFQAFLNDLKGVEGDELDTALPFARVGLSVLHRLGGEYAVTARRHGYGKDYDGWNYLKFPLQELEYEAAKFINVPPLQTCEYESATITAILDRFDFETATIAKENRLLGLRREWVIRRRPAIAWGYTEPLSSSIGLDMIAIPGGSFRMGAPEREPDSESSERPQHEVTLQPFYLSRYAVTQAQWREVSGYPPIEKELDPDPSSFKGDQHPVERVSWEDAQEFCQRLSQKTGQDYRLPSESQWEYACRAGTTTPYHFGETITTELANYHGDYTYNDGPKGKHREETTDVGRFPGNDWGLHDMHGNVWEWCEDNWHSDYEGAPSDGRAWVESDQKRIARLVRGGSWLNVPWHCRSAVRDFNSRDGRSHSFGFRVCCVPPSPLLSP